MDLTQGYSVYLACVRPWVEPPALQENNNKDKGNTGKEKLWTFCTVDFNTIQSGLGTRNFFGLTVCKIRHWAGWGDAADLGSS